LGSQTNEKRLRIALTQLPETLNKTYESALDRISAQPRHQAEIAMRALKWVTYAKRPLLARELQYAISFTPESKDFDENDLIEIPQVISFCAGILAPDLGLWVRLVHYTAQKYLETSLSSAEANAEIARACLRHLLLPRHPPSEPNDPPTLIFALPLGGIFDYAAKYWADHVPSDLEEQFHPLIFDVFESFGIRTSIFERVTHRGAFPNRLYGFGDITFLHLATVYGLPKLCQIELKKRKYASLEDYFADLGLLQNSRSIHLPVSRLSTPFLEGHHFPGLPKNPVSKSYDAF
jgi:hypothetical protein